MRQRICHFGFVTLAAINSRVFSLQLKTSEVVIECFRVQQFAKRIFCVALLAVGAQFSFVHIGVTQGTVIEILAFKVLEYIRCVYVSLQVVTLAAINLLMFSTQRESGLAVIEFAVVDGSK